MGFEVFNTTGSLKTTPGPHGLLSAEHSDTTSASPTNGDLIQAQSGAWARLPAAWTEVAYNAANFTTSGGGAWTVDSGDQRGYGYWKVGNTLFLRINIADTDVAASPGISLRIPLPAGYLAVKQQSFPMLYSDAGGVNIWGYVITTAGSATLLFRKLDNSNWTVTSGDNTAVSCNIELEVS